ncbi:MAG: hypothetical protein ABW022_15300 [Actinoplanes sp.]
MTLMVGGAVGLVLAAYGLWMLIAGRAPAATARVFRCVRDAAFYHLLFGVAVGLVVIGTALDRGVLTPAFSVAAIVLVAVAVVRFRPRGRRLAGEKPAGEKPAGEK